MHSKRTHKQNEKSTHKMGENICKWSNWQGIKLQNIQTAHAAQYQKNEQPNQKTNLGLLGGKRGEGQIGRLGMTYTHYYI